MWGEDERYRDAGGAASMENRTDEKSPQWLVVLVGPACPTKFLWKSLVVDSGKAVQDETSAFSKTATQLSLARWYRHLAQSANGQMMVKKQNSKGRRQRESKRRSRLVLCGFDRLETCDPSLLLFHHHHHHHHHHHPPSVFLLLR